MVNQVTVGRLKKALADLPDDAVVYFYCDGTRYEADVTQPIDESFLDEHKFIDVNLVP